jgi:hypothetical protein
LSAILLPFLSFFISIVKIFLAFRLVWGYTAIVMDTMPVCTLVFTVFSLAIARADIKTGAAPRAAFIAGFLYPAGAARGAFRRARRRGHRAGVFALARLITGGGLGLADV